jgi:hypothetical protein
MSLAATQDETRRVDRILAFTRDAISKRVKDQHFNHSPFLAALTGELLGEFGRGMMSGRAKRVQSGGESIVVRVNLGANTGAKRKTGPWDTNNTAPSDTVRFARANWRFAAVPVTLSDHDLRVNTGPEAISSLMENETTIGYRSLGEIVAGDAYENNGVSTAITDLDSIISAGDTVQGLSGATYNDWNSRGVTARGTAPASVTFASGSFAAQGLDDMRIAYNNASEGSMVPQAIYAGWLPYGYYEGSLQPQERFTNSNIADAGFMQLAFKSAPVFPDSYIPDSTTAGRMFFVNFECIEFVVLGGADFSMSEFVRVENQSARVAQIELTAQLTVKSRKYLNKLTTISA